MTAKLKLGNPRAPSKAPVEVDALADTGSVFLCIPQHICLQLGLDVASPNIASGIAKRGLTLKSSS